MIVSFGDRATADLYHGVRNARVRRFPPEVARRALPKFDVLDAAHELRDLAASPGHRLEPLRADWTGYWSIRVNDQWRLVFRWTKAGPAQVRLIDYH